MVQNRGILITLRAAAVVIIATGLNDVFASALPRYEPVYLYLAAVAVIALADGIVMGLFTALLSVAFYELLFTPRAEILTSRIVLPAGLAIATAVVFATIRGAYRVARRKRRQEPPPPPVYPTAPPLIETSTVARATEGNLDVLTAIDELRSELRSAVAELSQTRSRAEDLEILRRNQNAEREAVEARARQLEQDRDWALKTSQADRVTAERERALRLEAERKLAEVREEAASMAGRVAELELSLHEAERIRAEAGDLRRTLELERKRAEGEKALRDDLIADAGKLRTRITELEEAFAGAAPASEFDDLRRALADTRNARDRARAEAIAERSRADALERRISEAEGATGRVSELQAELDAERARRKELEAAAAQFDEKLATIAGHLASDHEADLGQAVAEREEARAEARSLRSRLAELEAALAEERTKGSSPATPGNDAALAQVVAEREEARAEAFAMRSRLAEMEARLGGELAARARLEKDAAEFDERLQTITAHLASDHEADLGQAMAEREEARAETRALRARLAELEMTLAEERAGRERMAAEAVQERAASERLQHEAAELEQRLQEITTRQASDLQTDLRQAAADRDEARAETRALRSRLTELEMTLAEERAGRERMTAEAEQERTARQRLQKEAAGFDQRLQTITAHLASDHETDIGQAVADREEARAEVRSLRARVNELEARLAEERAVRRRLEREAEEFDLNLQTVTSQVDPHRVTDLEAKLAQERAERERLEKAAAEFDSKLHTIVTHLASDHEADLGQALSEKEEARAEARALSMKLSQVQRKLDDTEQLLTETRNAAQAEIDRLRAQLASGSAPARPRVLLVHPDAEVRGAARASLERAGYDVVGAADGLEALRVAMATPPEVVIADSSMPKMDGRELCQLLKSQEKTAHIRFVLLMRANDDVPRGELVPDEILRKPVPVETLRATLASLLSPPS